jgi:hypothetical protein
MKARIERYTDLLGRVIRLYEHQQYADALAHVRAERVPSAFLVVCPAIGVSIDVVEGLGHDYPGDFAERVAPVLAQLVAIG